MLFVYSLKNKIVPENSYFYPTSHPGYNSILTSESGTFIT